MPFTLRMTLFLCIGTLGLLTIGCAPPASTPPQNNSAATKDDHDHEHGDHDHEHGKDDHDHAHDDHDHAHKDGDHEHKEGDHDEHAHAGKEKAPETYADAVHEIDELRKSIQENFEADKLKEADSAVHEVGHILEEVTKLAKKASLSDADQEEVQKNVEILFDALGKVDDRLHTKDASQGSDYKGVAKEVEAAIDVLKSKVKAPEAEKSEAAPAAEEKQEPETTDEGKAAEEKAAAEK